MSVVREAARTLFPPAGDRHGPLAPMMVALTFVTGLVDAASYLKLGHVFVANMTGNVVFLGFALAGARGLSAGSSLLALAAFLFGALLGGRLGARSSAHRGHLLRAASSLQVALLVLATALALFTAEPFGGDVRHALILLLAFSMGVQNASAQRLAVPELTTTVLTRTLTGLAAEAGLAMGPGAKAGRRIVAVAAMLLGALLGGLLALKVSVGSDLSLATATVLAVAVAVHLASRSNPAWTQT